MDQTNRMGNGSDVMVLWGYKACYSLADQNPVEPTFRVPASCGLPSLSPLGSNSERGRNVRHWKGEAPSLSPIELVSSLFAVCRLLFQLAVCCLLGPL